MTTTVWTFKTARFEVSLAIEEDHGYQYDGDDEGGEIQAKLDAGDYVAFDSYVSVRLDGTLIAQDSLGGSVYAANEVEGFWTDHRTSPFEYRNTLALKAKGAAICHYFPDMVHQAIREARGRLEAFHGVYVRKAAN